MSSKFSSFTKEKKIFDNWRAFLKGGAPPLLKEDKEHPPAEEPVRMPRRPPTGAPQPKSADAGPSKKLQKQTASLTKKVGAAKKGIEKFTKKVYRDLTPKEKINRNIDLAQLKFKKNKAEIKKLSKQGENVAARTALWQKNAKLEREIAALKAKRDELGPKSKPKSK